MNSTSALENVHFKGLFGDHDGKDEKSLLKISESKNFLIIQIALYKNSLTSIEDIKFDNLNLENNVLNV